MQPVKAMVKKNFSSSLCHLNIESISCGLVEARASMIFGQKSEARKKTPVDIQAKDFLPAAAFAESMKPEF